TDATSRRTPAGGQRTGPSAVSLLRRRRRGSPRTWCLHEETSAMLIDAFMLLRGGRDNDGSLDVVGECFDKRVPRECFSILSFKWKAGDATATTHEEPDEKGEEGAPPEEQPKPTPTPTQSQEGDVTPGIPTPPPLRPAPPGGPKKTITPIRRAWPVV